jgi:thiazole synthase ThiGH ThiG subunit
MALLSLTMVSLLQGYISSDLTYAHIHLGGRQVDGAIPSLYALETIMMSTKIKEAQQSGTLTILFDSGIRTGSDIFKAIALGAQAVLSEFTRCLTINR